MRAALSLCLVLLLTACSQNFGNTTSLPTNVSPVTPPAPPTPAPASIFQFTNATGTYQNFTGTSRPALVPVRAGGRFNTGTATFILDAQMAGPILTGATATNYYVFGINRGAATFPGPFQDEPNVIFDAVVLVTADPAKGLSASVTSLNPATPAVPVAVTLLAGAGDTFEVSIPASTLPSNGLALANYQWNLWPRTALGGAASAQIVAFIPNNQMGGFRPVTQ